MGYYHLNQPRIDEWMQFHRLKSDKELADLLGFDASYLCHIKAREKPITEFFRLRLHALLYPMASDEIFVPNFARINEAPVAYKSLLKFYGLMPYAPHSPVKAWLDHVAELGEK